MNSKIFTPLRIVFALLTIACMVMIFRFSMEDSDKSSKTSGKVTERAVEVFVKDYDELPKKKQETIRSKADHIVRKCAHYSIYMLLGFMASLTVGKRKIFSITSACVLGFCFLYACSDEIHQHFVPGRACAFKDVMIDTSGAVTGIIFSLLLITIASKLNAIRQKPAAKAA